MRKHPIRRALWKLHTRIAARTWRLDATGADGAVYLSLCCHIEVRLQPAEAEQLAESLRYQASVARGEAPARRIPA